MPQIRHIFQRLCETKVLQNFSYMAALNVFSALIGLLIYPYLIRVLGAEAMGLYAFLLGIVMYFSALIEFGFDMPSVKAVSISHDNPQELDRIVSLTSVCKGLMTLVSLAIAAPIVLMVPVLRDNVALFAVVFFQAIYPAFLPIWYYQGMKNMRFACIMQFAIRVSQVPLILLFVKGPDDLLLYSLIVSGTMMLGGLVGFLNLFREGRRLVSVDVAQVREMFMIAKPFFFTTITTTIKEKSLTTLIGFHLGMREVAIYDLAAKLIQLPCYFVSNINKALFPEVVANAAPERVRTILRYERLIGAAVVLAVALFSYPVILIFGGSDMLDAFPVAVILAFSVYSYLVVGGYLQFVFIARGEYSVVVNDQVVAMVCCLAICAVGLWMFPFAWVAALALSVSGFVEIIYCRLKQ